MYLNNRVDVNKVQTLNLMRLKTMRTFHTFQHTNNFLSHRTKQKKRINLHMSYIYITFSAELTSHKKLFNTIAIILLKFQFTVNDTGTVEVTTLRTLDSSP